MSDLTKLPVNGADNQMRGRMEEHERGVVVVKMSSVKGAQRKGKLFYFLKVSKNIM